MKHFVSLRYKAGWLRVNKRNNKQATTGFHASSDSMREWRLHDKLLKPAKQHFPSPSHLLTEASPVHTQTCRHTHTHNTACCGCCMETILPRGCWCRWQVGGLTGVTALALQGKRRRRRRLTTLIDQYLSPEPCGKCPAAGLIGGKMKLTGLGGWLSLECLVFLT